MANWYYYNENGEKIEVTVKELKELAAQGTITPGTLIETNTGRTGLAKAVKGLVFLGTVQSTESGSETESILENLEQKDFEQFQKDFERLQVQQAQQRTTQSVPPPATIPATVNSFPPPPPPPPPIIGSSKLAPLPLSMKRNRTPLVWPILATVIVLVVVGAFLFSGTHSQDQRPQPVVAKNVVLDVVPVEQPVNEPKPAPGQIEEPVNEPEPALKQNEEPVNKEKPEVVAEAEEQAPTFTAEEQAEIDKFIAEHGRDVKATDENGRTLLHNAAGKGNVSAVKFLISQGADIHAKDNIGQTPLHLATFHATKNGSHLEVVKLFFFKGADVHAQKNDGWTPVMLAAIPEHLEILRFLNSQGRC